MVQNFAFGGRRKLVEEPITKFTLDGQGQYFKRDRSRRRTKLLERRANSGNRKYSQ